MSILSNTVDDHDDVPLLESDTDTDTTIGYDEFNERKANSDTSDEIITRQLQKEARRQRRNDRANEAIATAAQLRRVARRRRRNERANDAPNSDSNTDTDTTIGYDEFNERKATSNVSDEVITRQLQREARRQRRNEQKSPTYNKLEVLFCICTLFTHVYVRYEDSIHLTIHVVYV